MRIAIVGGGINGLCCAWRLAESGHLVTLYERNEVMAATSSASSKLLHGGLRYLENGEFRLVREALGERDAWIRRAPHLAWPIRLVIPIYRNARRPKWMFSVALFVYDRIAGRSDLPRAQWLNASQVLQRDATIQPRDLIGGYEFSDAQMDDHALGLWVANKAREAGAVIQERVSVDTVSASGELKIEGAKLAFDRVVNAAGPWSVELLERGGIAPPFRLSTVRGSHLTLANPCFQPYLLEAPGERRIFFVLPWRGGTLLGTTEVSQSLEAPVLCAREEREYLLSAYLHYFPHQKPLVTGSFAGLRPLISSTDEPNRMSREYLIWSDGKLVSIFGGKWTTSMALADRVAQLLR